MGHTQLWKNNDSTINLFPIRKQSLPDVIPTDEFFYTSPFIEEEIIIVTEYPSEYPSPGSNPELTRETTQPAPQPSGYPFSWKNNNAPETTQPAPQPSGYPFSWKNNNAPETTQPAPQPSEYPFLQEDYSTSNPSSIPKTPQPSEYPFLQEDYSTPNFSLQNQPDSVIDLQPNSKAEVIPSEHPQAFIVTPLYGPPPNNIANVEEQPDRDAHLSITPQKEIPTMPRYVYSLRPTAPQYAVPIQPEQVASEEEHPLPKQDERLISNMDTGHFILIQNFNNLQAAYQQAQVIASQSFINDKLKDKVVVYKDTTEQNYRLLLGPLSSSEIGVQLYTIRYNGYKQAYQIN